MSLLTTLPLPAHALHPAQDTTVAELVAIGPMANLNAHAGRWIVVETMYPRGERIDAEDLWSGRVSTCLADAYDAHRVLAY